MTSCASFGLAVSGLLIAVALQSLCADTVAYYRFEEGALGAPVASDRAGSVIDSAGADDNFRVYSVKKAPIYSGLVPMASIPATGERNERSLLFDGSGDIYCESGGPLMRSPWSDFTIEAFVNFTSLAGFQTIIGHDDTFGDPLGQNYLLEALFYLQKTDANGFRVQVCLINGTLLSVSSADHIARANEWYHLAAVGDLAAGTLQLYVNGNLVGTATGYTGLFTPIPDTSWTIGRGQFEGALTDFVHGYIDEVRFSNESI